MTSPKSFDRIAETYDATRGGEDRGRRNAADLLPLLRPGSVLEIGIGTGLVALGLLELGRTVVGVDIGFEMAARARDRIGPKVAIGDAEGLPVRTESIDSVYSVALLHLVNVENVTQEVARVLRPGSRFLVLQEHTDPNAVDSIIAKMRRDLRSDIEDRTTDQIVGPAESADLRLTDRVAGSVRRFGVTPARAAGRIEARTNSWLWDVDDDLWTKVVVPAIDAIRALPEPDKQLAGEARTEILVFER